MGYDVYLMIDTGGPNQHSVWSENHTSNTAGMWDKAGATLRDWEGITASNAEPMLTAAIAEMEANPDTYRAMEPSNGWGSYESCINFLKSIRDACREHPRCTLNISR